MASPVTGPFMYETPIPPSGAQDRYLYKRWYRQRRPYDTPLPFSLHQKWFEYRSRPDYGSHAAWLPSGIGYGCEAETYNKAYSRFLDRLATKTDLAATILERKQAIDMVENRVDQLHMFFRALRRGHLSQATTWLFENGRLPSRSVTSKRRIRDFAGLVLEYQLGWFPLVMSIFDSIDILQSPFNDVHIRSRASGKGSQEQIGNPPISNPSYYRISDSAVYRVEIGSYIRISNPNLWLANQLGLVNPASWAWELTTLSFVIDWFANVGDFISSWTDFVGLDLVNPYVTYSGTTMRTDRYPNYGWSAVGATRWIERVPGPPAGPTLKIKPFTGLSWQRGATGISLLLQQLRG